MGAISQIPQLAVDLGIVLPDTLVWDPRGLDIFVNLEVPTTDLLEIVQTCPSSFQACLHFTADSGDGCQEAPDGLSKPTTNLHSGRSQRSPEHVQEPLLHQGRHSFFGSDVASLTSLAEGGNKDGENNAKVSTENGGTSITNCEITANVLSEVVKTDIDGGKLTEENRRRSVGPDDSSIPVSASAVFGIDGLDEDDILAACQLLVLSHEDLGEVGDETLAACRLLELSTCMSTDEEEEFDKYWNGFHGRSASVRLSASVNRSGTGLPYNNACTTSADENLDQENDQWGRLELDMSEHALSDLRTLKLKRIKPNKGPSDRDDDWDILERPPHKRQYKSLHQMH